MPTIKITKEEKVVPSDQIIAKALTNCGYTPGTITREKTSALADFTSPDGQYNLTTIRNQLIKLVPGAGQRSWLIESVS